MRDCAVARLQLETDLRKAVERHEFRVHYQVIVSLTTGRIVGFEALARWQHPSRGLIYPSEFISVAEETGLIIPLGKWVMEESCRQMKKWLDTYSIQPPLSICVNFSSKQFLQPGLAEQIDGVLQETGLPASCLKLELTESMIMENPEASSTLLHRLKKLGIQLGIDDFGTGYSSLSYLHRFPIDTLKIDRSFVNSMVEKKEEAEIVRTIITLAHNLGVNVIAEGVENPQQLQALKALYCESGQGYLFSNPVDGYYAEKLIQSWQKAEKEKGGNLAVFEPAQKRQTA
jgi:EAL domain-containing protein (putative c-di-GMP-specific phosphodiesterase class I)